MLKRLTMFVFLVLTVLSLSSIAFATETTNLGDELKSSLNKSGDSLEHVKDATMNAGNDIAGTVKDAGAAIGNKTREAVTPTVTNNNNYNATRVSNPKVLGMNSTTWIWLILGIVAVVVVLLSWYYMSDANREHRIEND